MATQLVQTFKRARKEFNGRLIVPYQTEGTGWMLSRELSNGTVKGGFLCDEMGLGKTAQTVATILGNRVPHTLIVTPKSITTQWESEIKKFAPQLKVIMYDGPNRKSILEKFQTADVVIAPYSVIFNRDKNKDPWNTPLHRYVWDRIVLDEGHEIRNRRSKTHKAAVAFRAKHRWVLSGTPVFNSMLDFVALSAFLGIPRQVVQAGPDTIRKRYVMRRTKEDLAHINQRLALPPCTFENMELEMFPEEAEVYEEAYNYSLELIKDIFATAVNVNSHTMEFLECLLRVRQCMVHPQLYYDGVALKSEKELQLYEGRSKKMETLLSEIKKHPQEKSLVFSQFITEMDMIHEMLNAQNIPVFRIDGSVSKDDRDARIREFRTSKPGSVFVIQIKAGGVGLNLQEATRVYITAPSWNPATELQAIGRAHRTGQTQRVVVKKLVYMGTDDLPSIEQSVMELQGHKSKVCAEVLNDKRLEGKIPIASSNGITVRDIKNIFKKKK